MDERTKRNGTKSNYTPVEIDKEQSFVYDDTIDLSKLEPTVAQHPDPGHRALAKELGNIQLDRAYIGSCTGGKTSDFLAFAEILKGRSVKIDTFGVPATPDVVFELQTTKWGDSSVWNILESAGVQMTENASCAACLGGPVDTFGRNEQAAELHLGDEPEFSGSHGSQGVEGVPRLALHGGGQRADGGRLPIRGSFSDPECFRWSGGRESSLQRRASWATPQRAFPPGGARTVRR